MELIEYKTYADRKRNQSQNSYNSAIFHYKDDNIEWFAEFDEEDHEILFRCGDYWRKSEYKDGLKAFVKDSLHRYWQYSYDDDGHVTNIETGYWDWN